MKTAAFFAALLATLTVATPVKRALVTEWEVVTVTVTKTAVATAAPTISQAPVKTVPTTTHVIESTSVSSTSSSTLVQSSSSVDSSHLSDYAAAVLKQHNVHRANHSVTPLEWDDELVGLAKDIADLCIYAHNNHFGDGQYGQNIGAGAPESDVPKMITNLMYNNEMVQYPGYGFEPSMNNFEGWGHFSQLVWKDTQRVGCYTNKCQTLQNVGSNVPPYLTVCNYRPQGNFGGQYSKNVLAPLGQPSIVL